MKILISFFDPEHDFHADNWRRVNTEGIHAEFYQQAIEDYDHHFLLSDDIPKRPSEHNETELKFWTQFRALRFYLEEAIKEHNLSVSLRFSNLDMTRKEEESTRMEELLLLIQNIKEEFPDSIIQAYITSGTKATRSIWHKVKEKASIDLFHIPLPSERGDSSLVQSYEFIQTGTTANPLTQNSSEDTESKTNLYTNEVIDRIYERAKNIGMNSSEITIILGETGTGKEEIAKHIYEHSIRKNWKGGFQTVNCAAFTDELLRSELFGHVAGAFTGANHEKKGFFEVAHNGVLFLDEIGDTSPYIQSALLRVLQSGEFQKVGSTITERYDVQIICATNANILEKIKAGTFRADLYYRFADPEIRTVALREFSDQEKEEILDFFLRKASTKEVHTSHGKHDRPRKYLTDEACNTLLRYDFPGNFRELQRLCESFYRLLKDNMFKEKISLYESNKKRLLKNTVLIMHKPSK